MQDRIILVVGKSGTGKTTLVNGICELGYKQVESYTTRPPRHKYEKGHIFVTPEEFMNRDDMIIKAHFFNNWYGTTLESLKTSHFYIVTPSEAEKLQQSLIYKNMMSIIINITCDEQTRLQRLKYRCNTLDTINRLNEEKQLFTRYLYNYEIDTTNGDLTRNIGKLMRLTTLYFD